MSETGLTGEAEAAVMTIITAIENALYEVDQVDWASVNYSVGSELARATNHLGEAHNFAERALADLRAVEFTG